jgi:hypothetical protein
LLEDDTLQRAWIRFDSRVGNFIETMNVDPSGPTLIDGVPLANPYEYNMKLKRQFLTGFRKQYSEFYFATLSKLMRDKELIYQK